MPPRTGRERKQLQERGADKAHESREQKKGARLKKLLSDREQESDATKEMVRKKGEGLSG